jgi:hypothetical protein
VTVTSEDGTVTFVAGTDYSADATAGVVTRLPDGAIAAEATVAVAFTVATPPETLQATALIDEIGRRQATTIAFVTPDGEGEIVVPNGRFSLSEAPTAHLYLEFRYDFDDAAAATIRELGLYMAPRRALHLERLALHLEGPPQIRRKLSETCKIKGLIHTRSIPENRIRRQRDHPQGAG